jgi:hypothetical protein
VTSLLLIDDINLLTKQSDGVFGVIQSISQSVRRHVSVHLYTYSAALWQPEKLLAVVCEQRGCTRVRLG